MPREAHANEDVRREARADKLLRKAARRALKRQKSQAKEKS
jgi:hypothetical protein